MKITNDDMKVLLKAQQGELDAVLMYKALAKKVKRTKDAETFNRLAQEEGHHAAVFKDLTNRVLKPKKTMAIVLPLLYSIIGRKLLYGLIAKGEYAAVEKYQAVVEKFPEIESVKNDEKRHGDMVMALLND